MSTLTLRWGSAMRKTVLVTIGGGLVAALLLSPTPSDDLTFTPLSYLPSDLAGAITAALWTALAIMGLRSMWLVARSRPKLRHLEHVRGFTREGRHRALAADMAAYGVHQHEVGAGERYVHAIGLDLLHQLRSTAEHLPLLGLLGTVLGILIAFDGQAAGSAPEVASGIATALQTTAAGLIFMLPASLVARSLEKSMDDATLHIQSALERRRAMPEGARLDAPHPAATRTRKAPHAAA